MLNECGEEQGIWNMKHLESKKKWHQSLPSACPFQHISLFLWKKHNIPAVEFYRET